MECNMLNLGKDFVPSKELNVDLYHVGPSKGPGYDVNFAIWAFLTWYGGTLVSHHGASGERVLGIGYSLIFDRLALGTTLPNLKQFYKA
ncbi:hypothetical protein SUGI_0628100 [Cryptomeria japonica]|nr:hypothetical protein SUGI_0628100 [Cryptomeria japonica]